MFLRSLLEAAKLQFLPDHQPEHRPYAIVSEQQFHQVIDELRDVSDDGNLDLAGRWLHTFKVEEGTPYDAWQQCFAVEVAESILRKQCRWNCNPSSVQNTIEKLKLTLQRYVRARSRPSVFNESTEQLQSKFDRLYIPVLRGLRPLVSSGQDVYAEATLRDYKTLQEGKCVIFTGQTIYEGVRKLLCGRHSERRLIKKFEDFLSESFFGGDEVALIPRHDGNGSLDIKIGRAKQYPISQLGDGIQAIIAITFPLFTKKEGPLLVGIEEPELNLHPGMQRTLIDVLRSFKDCQFLLATHSNHLLDLTLEVSDISVYTCQSRLTEGYGEELPTKVEITPVSHGDSSTLQLLGIRNSSVFLSNCTIWVEGITDRRYFSHYLRLYQDHLQQQKTSPDQPSTSFKEDLHYSFVEYGGSNITHWSWLDEVPDPIEVTRLCGRVMLIADNDNAEPGSKKAERHAALAAKLKNRFILLKSREVENLIDSNVLEQHLSSHGIKDVSGSIGTWEDYRGEKLGEWLRDRLSTLVKVNPFKSGSISDKLGFAEKVLPLMRSYEDLTPEAQEIAKRIHEFIRDSQGTHPI